MQDRRNFSRIKFGTEVQIKLNNKTFEGELLDISLKGALIQSNIQTPIKIGDCCALRFYLTSSVIRLKFNVELVHLHQNKLGFKFLSEDVDTMTHLRRLLELNVGEEDRITHELSFLSKV